MLQVDVALGPKIECSMGDCDMGRGIVKLHYDDSTDVLHYLYKLHHSNLLLLCQLWWYHCRKFRFHPIFRAAWTFEK